MNDDAPAPDAATTKAGAAEASAAVPDPAEYERIGKMLAGYLARQEQEGEEVKEIDLIAWYMEQVEDEIQTVVQLYEQASLVQLIVNRLIDKDHIIAVYRQSEDPQRPELRMLVMHPIGRYLGWHV